MTCLYHFKKAHPATSLPKASPPLELLSGNQRVLKDNVENFLSGRYAANQGLFKAMRAGLRLWGAEGLPYLLSRFDDYPALNSVQTEERDKIAWLLSLTARVAPQKLWTEYNKIVVQDHTWYLSFLKKEILLKALGRVLPPDRLNDFLKQAIHERPTSTDFQKKIFELIKSEKASLSLLKEQLIGCPDLLSTLQERQYELFYFLDDLLVYANEQKYHLVPEAEKAIRQLKNQNVDAFVNFEKLEGTLQHNVYFEKGFPKNKEWQKERAFGNDKTRITCYGVTNGLLTYPDLSDEQLILYLNNTVVMREPPARRQQLYEQLVKDEARFDQIEDLLLEKHTNYLFETPFYELLLQTPRPHQTMKKLKEHVRQFDKAINSTKQSSWLYKKEKSVFALLMCCLAERQQRPEKAAEYAELTLQSFRVYQKKDDLYHNRKFIQKIAESPAIRQNLKEGCLSGQKGDYHTPWRVACLADDAELLEAAFSDFLNHQGAPGLASFLPRQPLTVEKMLALVDSSAVLQKRPTLQRNLLSEMTTSFSELKQLPVQSQTLYENWLCKVVWDNAKKLDSYPQISDLLATVGGDKTLRLLKKINQFDSAFILLSVAKIRNKILRQKTTT